MHFKFLSFAFAATALLSLLSDARGELQVGAAVTQGALEWRAGLATDLPLVHQAIAYISHFTPLHAGDLIATGTPEGAGGSFSPPRFLKAGDHIEISVSGVGTLGNRVGA